MTLLVLDQTPAEGAALGTWRQMDVDVYQLRAALCEPLNRRGPAHPAEARVYSLAGEAWTSLALPSDHDLHWNSDVPGEQQLDDDAATARLAAGHAIQVFIFNGDADCVRHYVVLPLPAPITWLP